MRGTPIFSFMHKIFVANTVFVCACSHIQTEQAKSSKPTVKGGFQNTGCFSTETLETTLYLAFSGVMVHNGSMHVQGRDDRIVSLLRKGYSITVW